MRTTYVRGWPACKKSARSHEIITANQAAWKIFIAYKDGWLAFCTHSADPVGNCPLFRVTPRALNYSVCTHSLNLSLARRWQIGAITAASGAAAGARAKSRPIGAIKCLGNFISLLSLAANRCEFHFAAPDDGVARRRQSRWNIHDAIDSFARCFSRAVSSEIHSRRSILHQWRGWHWSWSFFYFFIRFISRDNYWVATYWWKLLFKLVSFDLQGGLAYRF